EALEAWDAAAVVEGRAFGLADLDVAGDLLMLRLVDEGAHLRLRIERIADSDLRGASGEALDETLIDAVLDKDAGSVRADLAGGVEIREHGAANRVLDIRVVEDDQRRLASELHRRVLHQGAGYAKHLATGGDGASQGDLGDRRMADERAADIAVPLHDVEQAIRQAGLNVQFG